MWWSLCDDDKTSMRRLLLFWLCFVSKMMMYVKLAQGTSYNSIFVRRYSCIFSCFSRTFKSFSAPFIDGHNRPIWKILNRTFLASDRKKIWIFLNVKILTKFPYKNSRRLYCFIRCSMDFQSLKLVKTPKLDWINKALNLLEL